VEVVVHFGAHKTATTFIQEFMKSKKPQLRKQGVGYVPLNVTREVLFPYVPRRVKALQQENKTQDPAKVAKLVLACVRPQAEGLPPLRRLVVSDENLAGSPHALVKSGQLYPEAPLRLQVMREMFPESQFSLLFCIRDYADFLVSCYCEVLRAHKLGPLPNLLASIRPEAMSWPRLFEQISSAMPGIELRFWRYEDFVHSPADVAAEMASVPLDDVKEAMSKKVRPSLSVKAVAMLQALSGIVSDAEHKRLANYLAEKFEFEENGGKLRINDEAQVEKLKQMYRADLEELDKKSAPLSGIIKRYTP
jgi:hypothetical protein